MNVSGRPTTPPCSPNQRNSLVDRGLDLYLASKTSRTALKWGSINIGLLSVLMFDISNQCPYAVSKWYYLEYAVAVLIACSVVFHFGRYFYIFFSFDPVQGTEEQRRLMQFEANDKSFVTTSPSSAGKKADVGGNNATFDVSNMSWHSSFNDANRNSTSWLYQRGSPSQSHASQSPHSSFQNNQSNQSSWSNSFHNNSSLLNKSGGGGGGGGGGLGGASANATFTSPYKNFNKKEIITEEHELEKYMRDMARQQEQHTASVIRNNEHVAGNAFNFRNYYNNAANLLKTSLYQLSPTTVSPNKQSSSKDDLVAGLFGSMSAAELDESAEIAKLGASGQLTQSIYNLRCWIAVTIFQRLDAEITKTNRAFSGNTNAECRGFSDIQIGKVALDRLKKTAELQQLVSCYVPMLPKIVPFLEATANQEYLVQRVRDLAKGCVLAEYRWSGGGAYNGIGWDEHMPTDSAIVFHVFCTYLDSQLPPLPQPGGRPFYNRYVVMGDKKSPDEIKAEVRNKSGCAILCTNALRPKFNFITNKTIHNAVHDRNNLFYVIVEFLVYMRTHNEGMLESVNLGRSGINLLRVIGD